MGATIWHAFTPYQADLGEALEAARRDAFARYAEPVVVDPAEFAAMRSAMPDADPAMIERLLRYGALSQRVLRVMQSNTAAMQELAADPKMMEVDGQSPSQEDVERLADFLRRHERQAKRDRPASIEVLLEQTAENGTHTIMDITEISGAPRLGAASPMPPALAIELYGSASPERAAILPRTGEAAEEMERWQAYYLVVHAAGEPSEVYFEGCSGD